MNNFIFTNWLKDFDEMVGKQNRKILLFLDNAPVHPQVIDLQHITIKFFPANTTSKIQPLDQGVIRNFKANYRRQLVQHIIASSKTAYSADDVVITALDAVCWIDNAWKSITESTIRNTFREAGFQMPISVSNSTSSLSKESNESISIDDTSFDDLKKSSLTYHHR